MTGDWRDLAVCREAVALGNDLWHPDDGRYEEARQVCAGCPVRAECRQFGMALLAEDGGVAGMYGGLTPRELRDAAAAEGLPTRKVAQHGSRARYVSWKCRCRACRAANTRDKLKRSRAS